MALQVLNPSRAKELRDALAEPQSRSGLAAALSQLKVTLDACGLAYQDLSGAFKRHRALAQTQSWVPRAAFDFEGVIL